MAELRLAFLGYDTDIGRELYELMEREEFALADLVPLSADAEEYDAVGYRGRNYLVRGAGDYDFADADALLAAGVCPGVREIAERALAKGLAVVDAAGIFPGEGRVFAAGLPEDKTGSVARGELVRPMSSEATMLWLLLGPLAARRPLASVHAVMLESVSGLGGPGVSELARESIALFNMKEIAPRMFPSQMAFNVHTSVGDIMEDNSAARENLILAELAGAMGEAARAVCLTSMVVPVFYGHTLSLDVTFGTPVAPGEFREMLAGIPGAEIVDDDEITPVKYGRREDKLYISRIRALPGNGSSYTLVAVMDNFRRGVVTNCMGALKKLALT